MPQILDQQKKEKPGVLDEKDPGYEDVEETGVELGLTARRRGNKADASES